MGKLSNLAVQHGTDKWGHHFYTEHYEKALGHLRKQKFNLLEIGIGGYEKPNHGGASLRMWADFFPLARITGFDVYDKSQIEKGDRKITTVQGDQSIPEHLTRLNHNHGPFHVVVDDGSHLVEHQLTAFKTLFPLLAPGGIYIIEDTETSYWPDYGGSPNINANHTCIAYFMHRVHLMMYRTNGLPKDELTDSIESIQFFNNIIIIRKGYNA